jgi:hypothetical protein
VYIMIAYMENVRMSIWFLYPSASIVIIQIADLIFPVLRPRNVSMRNKGKRTLSA